MLTVLKDDSVPQLINDVPNPPSEFELKNNKHISRINIVFDREGYSPEFFNEMWNHCLIVTTDHGIWVLYAHMF